MDALDREIPLWNDRAMEKLLVCYPFSDPRVELVEGFSVYDGTIGDEPGMPHKGIDYVLRQGDTCVPFPVYAMHDGEAFQGVSDSWGTFVIVYVVIGDTRYGTVYAHLDAIDGGIAPYFLDAAKKDKNPRGTPLRSGRLLGTTGTSGLTNGIPQLHLELHAKDLGAGTTLKLDPYGVNDRASSGRYPQPGASLHGLEHAWTTDRPPLAQA